MNKTTLFQPFGLDVGILIEELMHLLKGDHIQSYKWIYAVYFTKLFIICELYSAVHMISCVIIIL